MARKGMVKGMSVVKNTSMQKICEPCLHGKQTRILIPKVTENRETAVLAQIHSDICGKMQTKSYNGFEYFITFNDEASRKVDVAFLKAKSEVLKKFTAFVEWAEMESGR
jgi:abortive infection bacteriophage resistance protein